MLLHEVHIIILIHILTIGINEQEIFIDNYSKLTTVLKLSFKNLVPYFISKRIIDFDQKSKITTEDLLEKIMKHLKDGDTNHFYALLDIMKVHGNVADEELANAMEESLSLKQ